MCHRITYTRDYLPLAQMSEKIDRMEKMRDGNNVH